MDSTNKHEGRYVFEYGCCGVKNNNANDIPSSQDGSWEHALPILKHLHRHHQIYREANA